MVAAVTPDISIRRSGSDWQRKYPPLIAIGVAILMTVVILPSALKLPVANPTRTLEYAPVPPSDNNNPPNTGNLSSLGLASSGSLEGGGLPGGDQGGFENGVLSNALGFKPPGTKRCINTSSGLRQTDDPLSPPCAAYFSGDNFGATYQGVSREEIRIIFYVAGFTDYLETSQGSEATPDHQYFDLFDPPKPDEHLLVRALRAFQAYFYDRYQTWGRQPHFFVYFGGSDTSAPAVTADAIDNYNHVKPFASVILAADNADSYVKVMADRGVLNFGAFVGRETSFFQQYPKLLWGYLPTLETQAKAYSTFVCNKLVKTNATMAGGTLQGAPRKFGIVHYKPAAGSPDLHPELGKFYSLVVPQLQACGVNINAKDVATFPESGYVASSHYAPDYAATAMATFKTDNVTTVLWPGGLETNFTKEANTTNYQPEWILLGDGLSDSNATQTFQDQTTFNLHAWVVTTQTRLPEFRQTQCYKVLKEANPDMGDTDIQFSCDNNIYELIRQLFTGIQVAGPRLGPTSIDQGYHAVPAVQSTSPFVPACYYDPGDYTCVKDAIAEWWSTSDTPPGQRQPGCFMTTGPDANHKGQRYLSGHWPTTNIDQDVNNGGVRDICNTYGGSFTVNPAPPGS